MITGITDDERKAFMNDGLTLTSNEGKAKVFPHRKRNDLAS
jgi:hypothetical protein